MRSKDEIRKRINKLKNQFLNSTVVYQRTMIAQKIDTLKWVIKDISDDSWMFNLQENNHMSEQVDCTNCLHFDIETFYGVCSKHSMILDDVKPCEEFENCKEK